MQGDWNVMATKPIDYKDRLEKIKSESILNDIVNLYRPKIVGEDDNIKLLWRACISKDLQREHRLSALITSPSSAGKSILVNGILEPFSRHVLDFTDYSISESNRAKPQWQNIQDGADGAHQRQKPSHTTQPQVFANRGEAQNWSR